MPDFTFETTIEIDGIEVDVTVEANVDEHFPATREEPASGGCIEVYKVTNSETGIDLTDQADLTALEDDAADSAPTVEDELWAVADAMGDAIRNGDFD